MGYTFGFIGAGNMGGALARAACRWRPEQVVLTDRTLEKAVALAEELDCDIAMDNDAVAREAKFIFLGVKPQMMADMLAALAPTLEERGGGYVLVSMAPGWRKCWASPRPSCALCPTPPPPSARG